MNGHPFYLKKINWQIVKQTTSIYKIKESQLAKNLEDEPWKKPKNESPEARHPIRRIN